jgi:exonuclease V gamma subunit
MAWHASLIAAAFRSFAVYHLAETQDAEQGKSAGIEQATSFDEALWRKSVPQRDSPLRNLDSSSNLSFSDTTSQPQQQPYTAQNLYPTVC